MATATTTPQSGRPSPRSWLPEMAVDAACPYLTYVILTGQGASKVTALAAGAVFPATFVVVRFVRKRRLDGFGIAVLAVIGLSVVLALTSGNARFVLVKESFLTGAFGLAMLGSLVAGRRPLMFYTGRKFATDGTVEGLAAWDGYWEKSATFRRSNRVMTLVWGVAFVIEAIVRVIASYTLAVSTVVALSAVVPLIILGMLTAWTFAYGKRTRPASRAEVVAFSGA